jgi:hypothetical protein
LKKPFTGRYVVQHLHSQACHGVPISPQAFLSKYLSIEDEGPGAPFSRSQAQTLRWMERSSMNCAEAVVIVPETVPGIPGLEFVIRFQQHPSETIVEPVVLFNADSLPESQSLEEHNQECRNTLGVIVGGSAADTWLNQVFRRANRALGRLINAAMAEQPGAAGGGI